MIAVKLNCYNKFTSDSNKKCIGSGFLSRSTKGNRDALGRMFEDGSTGTKAEKWPRV